MAIENEDVLKDFTKKLTMDILNDIKNDLYKKAVKSDGVSPVFIRNSMEIPKSVYRYVGFNNDYFESSLKGDVCFSCTDDFNKNDDDDSKVYLNKNRILDYINNDNIFKSILFRYNYIPYSAADSVFMPQHYNIMKKDKKTKDEIFEKYSNHFIEGLRQKTKVACFTTCPYNINKNGMWDKKYFGDYGKGFCIEYNTYKQYFYPGSIMFLKILYETNTDPALGGKYTYDFTDTLINTARYFTAKHQMNDLLNSITKNIVYQEEYNTYLEICCELLNKIKCTSYNYIIHKLKEYSDEQEWRIIVPNNHWEEYFDSHLKNGKSLKNFHKSMASICLGPICNRENVEYYEEKYEYTLYICKSRNIPLYRAVDTGDENTYQVETIFTPEKE